MLRDKVRIDGRGLTDIRTLGAEVGYLPRVHGSALFERGETQILGVTTLNMLRMEQQLDTLSPENRKRYMHNYNFPPYSTGETGRVGSPKRREIGHGALAERALVPVLPSREEFPYAIRQVSEALGSNGSTSMGSVCASTLSLLNAGVPLKAPVAGIAMGLVSDTVTDDEGHESVQYVALTDILGAEDAFGDMDFKVAGTKSFVTALQLDTKLDGIPSEVLQGALTQARDARLTILEVMGEAIDAPDPMSQFAPRITTIKVPVDKIGEVIGPKGKMINSITEATGADIAIEDDGTIFVSGADGLAVQAAIDTINAIANPQLPKVGERFLGTVVKTTAFGAFVSLLPGRDGLVHISKLGNGKRIAKVEDVVSVGDKLQVEIAEIDARGKISLVPVAARRRRRFRGGAGRRRSGTGLSRTGWLRVPGGPASWRRGADGSAVTCSELPGGVRVVTESVPGARSASVGVWVGVGSVDETPRLAGASHYLEHLLFKGTKTRTGYEISAAVDAIGGELNAFTSHEYTCYYARVLAEEAATAVSLVCDVVLDATIARADVDIERGVILEEIAMRDDDPEDTLGDVFAAALFAGHPVAAPVIGTVQTISAMTRPQVAGYYHRRYTPDKMVIAVAGGVDHADVLRWVRAAFRDRITPVGTHDPSAVRPAPPRTGRGRVVTRPGTLVVHRDTEQAHLCIGVPAGNRNDPDRAALAVLSAVARRRDELAAVPQHP